MRTTLAAAVLAIGIASVVGQALALTDDFEGPGVDPAKWYIENTGGLSGRIADGELIVSGSYDSGDTIPNTGGWNGYFLISRASFAGQMEVSVAISTGAAAGSEYQVSLSLNAAAEPVNPATDSLFWQAYYLAGSQDSVGYLTRFLGETAYRAVLDPTDIVLGTTHVYRVVRNATGEASFYLDGAIRGTAAFITGDVRVVLHVGLHGAGTSISATFDSLLARANRPPTASLLASADSVELGTSVSFDAAGSSDPDGNVAAYNFDFGDGTNSGWREGPSITHLYTTTGRYNVTLLVRDDTGAVSEEPAWRVLEVHEVGPLSIIAPYVYLTLILAVGTGIVAYALLRRRRRRYPRS